MGVQNITCLSPKHLFFLKAPVSVNIAQFIHCSHRTPGIPPLLFPPCPLTVTPLPCAGMAVGGGGETVLNFYLFSHWPLVSTTTPSPTNLIQAATICCLDAYNHFLPDLPASSLAPISFRFLQGNQNNVFKPQI